MSRLPLLLLLALPGCGLLVDRDIVQEYREIPCPLVEPTLMCEAPSFGLPSTCREALAQNIRLRDLLACHRDHHAAVGRARAGCGDHDAE